MSTGRILVACRYGPEFIYLSNGRGYETRNLDAFERHLKFSKGCSALPPLIAFPKEEGWTMY